MRVSLDGGVAWFSEYPTIDKLRDVIKQDGTTGEDDLLMDVLSGHDTVVTSSEKKWGRNQLSTGEDVRRAECLSATNCTKYLTNFSNLILYGY